MKKIYIIGPVGSGKTTLAKKLSEKLNIKSYELDKIVWDDDKHIKRSNELRNKLFNNILEKSSWIIEDVGRKCFVKGIKQADVIYYIDLSELTIYKRCVFRWIKQLFGVEKSNYKQNISTLVSMLKWAHKDCSTKKDKLIFINKYTDKLKILKSKDITNI